MEYLEFVKAQGIGNDFILIDCLQDQPEEAGLTDLAVRLCDRNFGIGGDGLILVLPSDKADYRMRIINSDGSEPEMCGNGIRCFARYLYDRDLAKSPISVETLAGVMTIDVVPADGDVQFTVDMGAPRLEAEDIPVTGYTGQVISQELNVADSQYSITCVSMGNPHCIIFTEEPLESLALDRIGPGIETHAAFPRKTNVEFVRVINDHELKVIVWERGAGITLACGTGACASVVAGVLNGKNQRRATVHLPGGDLLIDWHENGRIFMTGAAEEVFTGRIKV